MKKFFSVGILLLSSVCVHAQPADADAVNRQPIDSGAELSRLQAQRAHEEARYEKEEAACYARFAVTDCLREVRARRRETLALLRQQEVALNDAQRKQKALEQLERIKEKTSPQRLEEDAARRREARADRQERQEQIRQKASAAMKAQSGSLPEPGVQKTFEPGRTADDLAREQQQYKDKLKEAQEHRASREKSNREKSGTPAKSLPVPP